MNIKSELPMTRTEVDVKNLRGKALSWALVACSESIDTYKSWVKANFDQGIVPAGHDANDWLYIGDLISNFGVSLQPRYHAAEGVADAPINLWDATIRTAGNNFLVASGLTPQEAVASCIIRRQVGDLIAIPDALLSECAS